MHEPKAKAGSGAFSPVGEIGSREEDDTAEGGRTACNTKCFLRAKDNRNREEMLRPRRLCGVTRYESNHNVRGMGTSRLALADLGEGGIDRGYGH